MKLIITLIAVLFCSVGFANSTLQKIKTSLTTNYKYHGNCTEVDTGQIQPSTINVNVDHYPLIYVNYGDQILQENIGVRQKLPITGNSERWFVFNELNGISKKDFSLNTYGLQHQKSPWFFNLKIDFIFKQNESHLKTTQIQTSHIDNFTYTSNKWNCEYEKQVE